MVYDQAQSPRLGQRVPIESTYVQIFDVDPDTGIPDLPEAAYPGQLIFRNDLGILQVWDETADTWLNVAGGVAGQHTYVGPEFPTGTSFNLGDLYYDSDDAMKGYVWNGSFWVVTTVSASDVRGGTFTEGIHLANRLVSTIGPNGERVEMDQDGLRVYGPFAPSGLLRTDLNADGTQSFKGNAEIDYLTTNQQLTMRQQANQLSRGGVLALNAGVTPPGNSPTVTINWESLPLTGRDLTGYQILDMAWDPTLNRWLMFTLGGGNIQVLRYTSTGAYDGNLGPITLTFGTGHTAGARMGGQNYWLSPYSFNTDFPFALQTAADDGTGADSIFISPQNTSSSFSLATDGSQVVMAEYRSIAGNPWIELQRFAQQSAGANLLQNGNFELGILGFTPWTAHGAVSMSRITNTNRINGTASLQVVSDNTNDGWIGSEQNNVVARRRYLAQMQIKRIAGTGGQVGIQVVWYTSGGAVIKTDDYTTSVTGTAAAQGMQVYAPVNAATAQVRITFPQGNRTWVVDDITFNEMAGLQYISTDEIQMSSQAIPNGGVYIGNGDFGAKHYVIGSSSSLNKAFVASDSAKVEDPANKSFPLPTVPKGIGYDGTDFWTLGSDNVLYKHPHGNNFTSEPTSWYTATTFIDSVNGYETVMGPTRSFTMKRRARLVITGTPINITGTGDPNLIGYYVARKSLPPGRTDFHLQAAVPDPSVFIDAATFTSASPPATSNFPSAVNSAELKSAAESPAGSPLIQFWGDGHWRLGSLSGDASGAVSGLPSGGGSGGGSTTVYHGEWNTTTSPNVADITWTTRAGWVPIGTPLGITGPVGGVFTVTNAGIYLMAFVITFAPNSSNRRYARILLNNTTPIAQWEETPSTVGAGRVGLGGAISYYLPAGSTIQIQGYQNTGGNLAWDPLAEANVFSIASIAGAAGVGVPSGGAPNQMLVKATATDYDTIWVTGPIGTAGGDLAGSYPNPTLITKTFNFAVASNNWNCAHNLGKVGVKAFTTDLSGSEIRGDVIHVDANNLTVSWVSPTTGTCYITP